MSIFARITGIESLDDGSLTVVAATSVAVADMVEARQACDSFGRDGTVLREMRSTAAGLVEKLNIVDGVLRLVARVIDPSSILKVRHKVLRFFQVAPRFVDLIDRPDGFQKLCLWKATSNMTTHTLAEQFRKTFVAEFTKAMAASDDGAEHDMNATNPNRLASAPDEPEDDMPALRAALSGLHTVGPRDLVQNAALAAFRVGHSAQNFYDLVSDVTFPLAKPKRDFFLEQMVIAGGADLADRTALGPRTETAEARSMTKSNSAPSETMRKAQGGLAEPYRGNGLYETMLLSNGPAAPFALRKGASPAPAYAGETAALLRSNSAA